MVSDNNGGLKKALLPLAPSRLTGEKSEILSTINENGESEFKIDEIQFEDLYVDDLYVDGNSINTLIPNVQYLKGLEKIDTNDNPPYDSQLIVEKINDIIDRLNYIYQSQTNTPIQSRTHARGNE